MGTKHNPVVTVIVPTYNHAHFLSKALQSILDQTYPYWEALVVDNHSPDQTDEVVRRFGDPRVRIIKIHNNGVIAASRNLGIRVSHGDWIAFLDSDDYWFPKKLEVIMSLVVNNDAYDVFCSDEVMINLNTGNNRILYHGPYNKEFYEVLLIEGNRLSTSATVVRRSFLERNDISFDESRDYVTVEDYGLWLDLARAGARFKFLRQVLGAYVIHGKNNSAQLDLHLRNYEALLRHHVFKIQKFDSIPNRLWSRVCPRLQLQKLKQLIENREWSNAFALFLTIFLSSPKVAIIHLMSKLNRLLRPHYRI